MKNEYHSDIEIKLKDIPEGRLLTERRSADGSLPAVSMKNLPGGKGKIVVFTVFPGTEIAFNQIRADRMTFHRGEKNHILRIDHCRGGCAVLNTKNGIPVCFGAGDILIHPPERPAESEIHFPFGYYDGLTVSVDMNAFGKTDILREADIDCTRICKKLCPENIPAAIPRENGIDKIFSAVYDPPGHIQIPYYKLKIQEILMFLGMTEPLKTHDSAEDGRTEIIREIHDMLMQNLDKRFTIEELSKKYLINTSSLKSVFRAVYGLPVSAYVKEHRIKKSMELLLKTDKSISEISNAVGYKTQSKFTQTFKDMTDITPTEYRRLYRGK
ncbi:MAG: helix-turn-helix transcriptional regulator [Oscillospiraceae bacterium]|nr:helix-turn-helix transcriptional regulator [Oscillospiraceae bacterium]